MIKFFRNIRQNIINPNRVSRYILYALGEIILVVIGILIALQINNWNDKRKESNKERSIKSDLNQEFTQNWFQLDTVLNAHLSTIKSLDWLIGKFPDYENANPDSLGYHLKMSASTWTFNPSQATVRSLTNTSSFDIIKDERLRKQLIQWQDLYDDFSEEEEQSVQFFTTIYVPYFQENSSAEWISPFEIMKNPEDLTGLQSKEFHNLLLLRRISMKVIIEDNPELVNIRRNIRSIIDLTE